MKSGPLAPSGRDGNANLNNAAGAGFAPCGDAPAAECFA